MNRWPCCIRIAYKKIVECPGLRWRMIDDKLGVAKAEIKEEKKKRGLNKIENIRGNYNKIPAPYSLVKSKKFVKKGFSVNICNITKPYENRLLYELTLKKSFVLLITDLLSINFAAAGSTLPLFDDHRTT